MKSLRIYDMLTDNGSTLEDIILQVPVDYDYIMIFNMVTEKTGIDIDSYSYEEV